MRNIYVDGEYASRNPTFHVADSPWKAEQVAKALARNHLAPRSVCDLGCGAGEVLRSLAPRLPDSATCHGYDISPHAIARAREQNGSGITFHCEDFLSVETERYDVLLCLDVFEHVADYFGFLESVRDRAEHKLFHIPLDLSVQWLARSEPILRQRRGVGHLHHFTKETALDTLERAGYSVLDWFYTAGFLDLPDKSILQRLARIPRRVCFRLNPDGTVRWLGGYSLFAVTR
jgi:SAM-dependent methyltransferase